MHTPNNPLLNGILMTSLLAAAALAVPPAAPIPPASSRRAQPAASSRPAADATEPTSVSAWLAQPIDRIEWDDKPFDEVIAWLRDLPGEMNIDVNWYALELAGVDREAPVSLHYRRVPLRVVLDAALRHAGRDVELGILAVDNVLRISTADEFRQRLVVRAYPVADLLHRVRAFNEPPSLNVDGLQQTSYGGDQSGRPGTVWSGGGEENLPLDPDQRLARLIEVIVNTIEPQTWSQNGGPGTIEFFNDRIVVNNTLAVHERLAGPLGTGAH